MEISIKASPAQCGESLCRTCQWVHMLRGFRESEEVLICQFVYPNRAVPFAVRECNDYRSSITPSPKQMEEIALIIPTAPPRKPAGFAGLSFSTDDEEMEIGPIVANE
jgi:hypothetical protein